MRKTIRLLAVVVLVLAGCTERAEEGTPSASMALETPDRSFPRIEGEDVAMPEGTWTGRVRSDWDPYLVRVTFPATCMAGRPAPRTGGVVGSEPCGRQELTFPDGSTCGGPFVAVTSNGGSLRFRDSFTHSRGGVPCDPGYTTIGLEPRGGGTLDYLTTGGHGVGGWGIAHGILRPTGAS